MAFLKRASAGFPASSSRCKLALRTRRLSFDFLKELRYKLDLNVKKLRFKFSKDLIGDDSEYSFQKPVPPMKSTSSVGRRASRTAATPIRPTAQESVWKAASACKDT